MDFYIANLIVLVGIFAAASYAQQTRKSESLQPSDRDGGESAQLEKLSYLDKPGGFEQFRNAFLKVYALAIAADWLQVRCCPALFGHTI